MVGESLGSIDGIEVGCIEGTEPCISDEILLVTTLVTYDGKYLVLSYCSSDGTSDWIF